MRILITSLSGHRIDELLADYAYEAMRHSTEHEFYRDTAHTVELYDALWVFNGLNNSKRSATILKMAKRLPTMYFWDDHSLPTFNFTTTISQFEGMGDRHFQISELAVFDKKWDEVINFENKIYDFVYWGHRKPERQEQYDKFIVDNDTSLLIGDWKAEKAFNAPYDRDMRRLHGLIKQGKYTIVFGDKIHNGRSIPLRVYEAAMNGLVVFFDKDLVQGQKFTIDEKYILSDEYKGPFTFDYYDFKTSLLRGTIEEARDRVRQNLMEVTK